MAFEGLRDRWEHMTPRERTLMALLGVALVVTVFGVIGMTITDGLGDIADKNEARRDALQSLAVYRQQKAEGQGDTPKVKIPREPVDLPAYLEDIAKEVGVEIPSYSPQPQGQRGSYDEIAVNIDLRELTVYELADFLEKVETRNRAVVITQLHVERSFRDEDKLRKASMTVATYAKKQAGGDGGDSGGDGEAGGGDGGSEADGEGEGG